MTNPNNPRDTNKQPRITAQTAAELIQHYGLIRHCIIAGTPLNWLPEIEALVTPIEPQVIAWVQHNEAHRKTCADDLDVDDGPQIGFLEFLDQHNRAGAFLNNHQSMLPKDD